MSGMLRSSTTTSYGWPARPPRRAGARARVRRGRRRRRSIPHEPSCSRRIEPVRGVVVDDQRAQRRRARRRPTRASGAPSCLANGQLEPEGAARARRALGADRAVHQLDELLHDREAEARSRRSDGSSTSLPARTARTAARGRRRRCRRRCRSPRSGTRTSIVGLSETLRARTTTSPSAVNFTALDARFSRIWRSRVGIAAQRRRQLRREVRRAARSTCAFAASPSIAATSSTSRPRSKSTGLELELARLDLREVEDVVDDAEQPVGRRSGRRGRTRAARRRAAVSSSSPLRPMIAFIGRADLVAHRREELRLRLRRAERPVACRRQLGGGLLSLGHVARVHDEAAHVAVARAGSSPCPPSTGHSPSRCRSRNCELDRRARAARGTRANASITRRLSSGCSRSVSFVPTMLVRLVAEDPCRGRALVPGDRRARRAR